MLNQSKPKVLALSGGVGGAKLALGFSQILDEHALAIVTNTADDFEHLGLPISPDLDTVMYTLAGLNDQQQGWGLANESWQFMQALHELDGDTWFRLGDKDLATHIQRQQLLSHYSLSAVTAKLCQKLGVQHAIIPMCNESVSTQVVLAQDFASYQRGDRMDFQHYFVRYQCEPEIEAYHFDGIESARISEELSEAINSAQVLVVCPSNPFVSIEPILSVPGLKTALMGLAQRVVVSPIVDGLAIKGPAAKMMQELNMPVTALSVAELYRGFATHFVLDSSDSQYLDAIEMLGMKVLLTNTIMHTTADKSRLALDILEFVND